MWLLLAVALATPEADAWFRSTLQAFQKFAAGDEHVLAEELRAWSRHEADAGVYKKISDVLQGVEVTTAALDAALSTDSSPQAPLAAAAPVVTAPVANAPVATAPALAPVAPASVAPAPVVPAADVGLTAHVASVDAPVAAIAAEPVAPSDGTRHISALRGSASMWSWKPAPLLSASELAAVGLSAPAPVSVPSVGKAATVALMPVAGSVTVAPKVPARVATAAPEPVADTAAPEPVAATAAPEPVAATAAPEPVAATPTAAPGPPDSNPELADVQRENPMAYSFVKALLLKKSMGLIPAANADAPPPVHHSTAGMFSWKPPDSASDLLSEEQSVGKTRIGTEMTKTAEEDKGHGLAAWLGHKVPALPTSPITETAPSVPAEALVKTGAKAGGMFSWHPSDSAADLMSVDPGNAPETPRSAAPSTPRVAVASKPSVATPSAPTQAETASSSNAVLNQFMADMS